MGDIKKVLVANRGEIALRVMKTCYRMNIKTVAIFSDADQKAPFVKYADEKIYIGPSPSNKSYLNQDLIIKSCSLDGQGYITACSSIITWIKLLDPMK